MTYRARLRPDEAFSAWRFAFAIALVLYAPPIFRFLRAHRAALTLESLDGVAGPAPTG